MAVQTRDAVVAQQLSKAQTTSTGRLRVFWLDYGKFVLPVTYLVFLVLACFIWPLIYPVPPPTGGGFSAANKLPFSAGHLLGTDPLGNDILSRLLYGGRVSLEVGFGSVGIGMVVGSGLGVVAGYLGGFVDTAIMRSLDILLAFPSLVLALIVTTYLGPSEIHVIWAICFFSIPAFARLARSHTLRLRQQAFVLAASLCGTSHTKVILKHLAPNVFPPVLTFAFLGVAVAILVEAALSFLGLGVPPPAPSWGNMISQGKTYLATNPYLVLIPVIVLWATATALNKLGDALRDHWSS